jgi:predicted nucleic acid-binding protein
VIEAAKEYLELRRQVELKKLRRKLAAEEEFEAHQAACEEQSRCQIQPDQNRNQQVDQSNGDPDS